MSLDEGCTSLGSLEDFQSMEVVVKLKQRDDNPELALSCLPGWPTFYFASAITSKNWGFSQRNDKTLETIHVDPVGMT